VIASLAAAMMLVLGTFTSVLPGEPGAMATVTRSTAATPTARTAGTTILLGGVHVRLRAGTRQVVTVNHTYGSHARLVLWQQGTSGWQAVARSKAGRTGYGGLVAARLRKQATGTTPLGTFRLLYSFGTHSRAASWDLQHRVIRRGDFWVQDNASAYYNRYRNKSQGGFRWWLPQSDENSSERLRDYPTQYEYAVVTSFNYAAQVRHRGAGIFLHVNGRGATAGCVSAPRWFLQKTLAVLDPAQVPVIAIGR
jgi:L,D-peptidoglycan transpeptidase YkuD (ErfK/YbiS/YcfS/YnhG family)